MGPLTDAAIKSQVITLPGSEKVIGLWKYGAYCIGVRKRCRKIERHISDPLGTTTGEPSRDEAKRLADEWIFRNMKSTTKAYATATYWTSGTNGMEGWEPFTDAHNLRWEI